MRRRAQPTFVVIEVDPPADIEARRARALEVVLGIALRIAREERARSVEAPRSSLAEAS